MADSNAIIIPITGDKGQLEKAISDAVASLENFGKTAEDVSSYVNSWSTKAQKLSLAFVGFEKIASSVKGTIKSLMGSFVSFGDQLDKMSIRTNISAEDLSKLKFASEQCGAGFEEAVDAIKTFQNTLGAEKLGDEGAAKKLQKVGIDYNDYDNLTSQEQFLKLADHIASLKSSTEQTRVAMELFGDAGFKLLPLLKQGKSGIAELYAEAERLGFVMGGDDVASAAALSDEINRMKSSMAATGRQIMAALVKPLTDLLEFTRNIMQGINQFCAENPKLVSAIAAAAGTIAVLGTAISAVSAACAALQMASPAMLIAVGAIAVAAATLSVAAGDAGEKLEKLNTELDDSKKGFESLKEEQANYAAMVERLQDLSEMESLTNEQREEASSLVEKITDKYGDLGLEIDSNTGKVKDMNEKMEEYYKTCQKERAAELHHQAQLLHAKAQELALEATKNGVQWSDIKDFALNFNPFDDTWHDTRADKMKLSDQYATEAAGLTGQAIQIENQSPEGMRRQIVSEQFGRSGEQKVATALTKIDEYEKETQAQVFSEEEKKNQALLEEYQRRQQLLNTVEDELKMLKENGLATQEQLKTLEQIKTKREDIAKWYYAESLKIAEARKAAAKEKAEADSQEAIAMGTKAVEAGKKAEATRKELESGDQQLLKPRQQQEYEEAQDWYTKVISNPQSDQESIGLAKKSLQDSLREYKSYSLDQAKREMESSKKEAERIRKLYSETRYDPSLSDEAKLKIQKSALSAQEDYSTKRDKYRTLADQSFQERLDAARGSEKGMGTKGTFSAYGMDAVAYSDIPSQTLDYIKRIFNLVGGIQNNQLQDGVMI